jgi:serine/threonine-protein kinase HipA
MKRLIVYLNGEKVGTLEQDNSGLDEFRYSQEWLQKTDALPLSRALPLQADVFRGKQTRPFFAGILPEEGPRRQIASILGISERNDFAMLERIGGECAGAVSLLPEGINPPVVGEMRLRELNDQELREIIDELHHRPLMAGQEGIRLSLAGAQDKLPVVLRGERLSLPLGNTPSTHIVKPEPDRFPGLVANEVFCMTLAKSVGLKSATVENRQLGGRACTLVQRYDRIMGADGVIIRLHQEDFCQALGFPPERKYQQEGGPLLRDCIALLREWSTTPVLDIREFIDGQIFNLIIGNADAHGKNFSMIYQGRQRRLAPFYDLVCTKVWPELSQNLAMKIGGGAVLDAITNEHWQKMAKEAQLGWPMIRERMVELSHRIIKTIELLQSQKGAAADNMVDRVAGIIFKRASAMSQT